MIHCNVAYTLTRFPVVITPTDKHVPIRHRCPQCRTPLDGIRCPECGMLSFTYSTKKLLVPDPKWRR